MSATGGRAPRGDDGVQAETTPEDTVSGRLRQRNSIAGVAHSQLISAKVGRNRLKVKHSLFILYIPLH